MQTAADLGSFAFAQRFGVGYGCRIVLADHDAGSLSKAEAELKEAGVDVLAVETDVSDLASVEKLRDTVDAKMGGADVVLLAAAVSGANGKVGGPYSNIEAWQKVRKAQLCHLTEQVIATNLFGVINGIHAFAPAMVKRKEPGMIICVGSKQVRFTERAPD